MRKGSKANKHFVEPVQFFRQSAASLSAASRASSPLPGTMSLLRGVECGVRGWGCVLLGHGLCDARSVRAILHHGLGQKTNVTASWTPELHGLGLCIHAVFWWHFHAGTRMHSVSVEALQV